jgi:hypothetical protein
VTEKYPSGKSLTETFTGSVFLLEMNFPGKHASTEGDASPSDRRSAMASLETAISRNREALPSFLRLKDAARAAFKYQSTASSLSLAIKGTFISLPNGFKD